MIVILEGLDRCGKSTQIRKMQPLLIDKPLQVMHYMAIKGFDDNSDVKEYSEKMYKQMFHILLTNYPDNNFILDRAHIGEVVYSPIYRDYSGDYVYEIEEDFKSHFAKFWNQIYLITFVDKADNLISRDDGLSFTTKIDKKNVEINSFISATDKSLITNKLILNIDGKDEEVVYEEIKKFIKK